MAQPQNTKPMYISDVQTMKRMMFGMAPFNVRMRML